MKIPQTLTGVGLVLGGALSSLIPVIGPTVAPYIVGSGVAVITKGSYDKVTRKKRGEDAFEKEKAIIKKITGK